jgi:hypothetical protein
MASTIRHWALVATALLAFADGARAGERTAVNRRTGLVEPPLSDLRKAAERGDRAELARAAGRLGPARLAKALGDPERKNVLAALEGVPLANGGILVLDQVLPLLASADDGVRAAAVRTTATLLQTNDTSSLGEWEVTTETAQAACQTLARVASNERESAPTRLLALQGLADAAIPCTTGAPLSALLAARDPDIRRAAVLLWAGTEANFLASAARDRDPRVAAAAGARLCQRRTKNQALPAEPPLRQLALAAGALPEDVIEMLPCLATSADPADQKAVEDLRNSSAASVREAATTVHEAAARPRDKTR